MSRILWLSSLRYLLRHPWQVGLSVLGIALGVAVVVSIDLANDSASRAFSLATQTVAGKATHQVVGGPTGLPEDVYRRLVVDSGVRPAAPVVEGDVAAPDFPGRTFHLLGVDPFAEGPLRPYLSSNLGGGANLAAFFTRPGTVLLSAPTASQLGLRAGNSFALRVGSARQTVTLVGVLEPGDDLSRRALDNVLVADIATAQELLSMQGRLSHIDLILPAPGGQAGDAALATVQAALPPGAQVLAAGARSDALAQMTRAFDLNLSALSLLALVVGMFLIYNTITFSVVQRRTLIGTLRAVGVVRREIFVLVLSEALLVGLVGTALGLPLGIVLGRGMVRLVTQTINDLYFVLSVNELTVAPFALAKGALLGMGATLLAALAPALEATSAPPRAVLSRSVAEGRTRRAVPRLALAGLALCALGGGLLVIPSRDLVTSFGGLLAVVLGFALLTPVATVALMSLLGPAAGAAFGVLGRMAARGVVAALSRTAVAVAALMIAVSVTVGVGVMVDSFRQTVVSWLETSLQADIYVSAPSLISNRADSTIDPALARRLAAAPGVDFVGTYRRVQVRGSAGGATELVALNVDERAYRAFRFKEGDPASIWPAFAGGRAVIVSEPYAYHHDLHAGDVLRLHSDRGEREFPVAGVFFDYGSDQGLVMIDRGAYEPLWDDRDISSLGIYVKPGADVTAEVSALRQVIGADADVLVRSNRALREASLAVFDRTFAITDVLRLLTTAVAFVGVLSALMALQLERTRELGVLRANGLTPRQVWGLVTWQTGLMGLVAGLLSLPVGIVMALVLVYVINRRSFGWTLQLRVDPMILLQALLLALVAAMLAGLYPALRMARTSPAVALREE
ncbi:MAG: FtsX-like permease family protein [Chloroflexota bacterium]